MKMKKISLSNDLFQNFKDQFEHILQSTIKDMTEKNCNQAGIQVKILINLIPQTMTDPNGNEKNFMRPEIKHTINSCFQVKNKIDGDMPEQYELFFDDKNHSFYLKEIVDPQGKLL